MSDKRILTTVGRARIGFVSDEEDEAAIVGDEENEDTQETPVVSVSQEAATVEWWLS